MMDRRWRICLWCIRIAVCVCVIVAVCLSVALWRQTKVLAKGSASDPIRIYIDQGHNPASYHNSGAEGNGLYEQDVTFRIGCLLAELLEADGRFEVCLSRPYPDTVLGHDNTSSLQARVDGAADFRADYFISLHINAYSQDTANGAEVLVPSLDPESRDFGSCLLEGLIESTALRNRGVKENSNLYVLKHADMPAVLLEMGFITNGADAALLAAHPERFAQGVYNGILAYFDFTHTSRGGILPAMIGLAVGLTIAFAATGFILTAKYKSVEREKQSEIALSF